MQCSLESHGHFLVQQSLSENCRAVQTAGFLGLASLAFLRQIHQMRADLALAGHCLKTTHAPFPGSMLVLQKDRAALVACQHDFLAQSGDLHSTEECTLQQLT